MSDRGPELDPTPRARSTRERLASVFGWLAGGSLGLLVNYGLFLWLGEVDYPVVPTTFATFIVGALGGAGLADRYGERAFRPLAMAAGLYFSLFIALVVAVFLSPAPGDVP